LLFGWLLFGWLLFGCLVGFTLSSTQQCSPQFVPNLLYPSISLTLSHIKRPNLSPIPTHKPTTHNKYIPKISENSRRSRALKRAP
jgi:hypothetical protein